MVFWFILTLSTCIASKKYSLLKNPHFEFLLKAKKERKKVFLSDRGKEIEENNRIRKTSDLFKKISDTKGTFHAKMGTIRDRDGMDLTEAEDIKRRWQEYTEL